MLGYTPQEVKALSLWEFTAAVEGYAKAHSSEPDGLSAAETDELWAWMQDKDGAA